MYTGEAIAALVSIIYFNREKTALETFRIISYCHFSMRIIRKMGEKALRIDRIIFYNYFVMPLQFIFFYWLYAIKSLEKPKLFYIFSLLYFAAFIPNELYFCRKKIVFAFNYTLGCLFLMVLVIMEYYKQVNSRKF
jgi:hypothetical protein